MKSVSAAVAVMTVMCAHLGGCAPASQAPDTPVQREWKRLSDGSFFESHNPFDTGEPLLEGLSHRRLASRCWPADSHHDCIVLSYDHDGGDAAHVTAERLSYATLEDSATIGIGYSCSARGRVMFGILYQESITSADGDKLLENMHTVRPPIENGWDASFVSRFLEENEITEGARFFNCIGLRKLLDDGGPATLGTTVATRDQFFNFPGSADAALGHNHADAIGTPQDANRAMEGLSARDTRRAPTDRDLEMGLRHAIELNEMICAQTGQNCEFAKMARRQHEERYGAF